jgi:transcriptional regulator with PAS, ATPase and Fis domain
MPLSRALRVIITGESGTGKELAARAIHDRSPRHNRPYIDIDCAAVPESLIESELFGHERGAFNGADRRRERCFERANGGSLLLDEITEMRPKLLRVLEERRILRLGASKELPIDMQA